MKRTARGLVTRGLAALALTAVYGLSALGVTSVVAPQKAEARGRGGRGRGFSGFRGGRRGGFGRRGRGFGIGWGPAFYGSYYGYGAYNDRCFYSPRRGRWVCPYPSYYRYYW